MGLSLEPKASPASLLVRDEGGIDVNVCVQELRTVHFSLPLVARLLLVVFVHSLLVDRLVVKLRFFITVCLDLRVDANLLAESPRCNPPPLAVPLPLQDGFPATFESRLQFLRCQRS